MKKKIKIGVIGLKGLPAFGGAATVGENIIDQLKDDYDFTVYSTSSHTDKKTSSMNGYFQIVFRSIPFKKLNTLYYYILAAFHALFFRKYDLIHLHHRDAAFLILLLRLKYKVIITTHGRSIVDKWQAFEWFFRIQEKYFVKYANQIVCVSKNEVNYYNNKHGIEAIHIPNGMYVPAAKDSIYKKSSENYLFFGAGRIVQSKGCVTMLKALKKINYHSLILIAGNLDSSKSHKSEVLYEAKELNTRFLGLIKEKEVLMNYIRNASLFLFPSSMEAMSMMLLEAVSVKVPVICSDIKENRDIFSSDELLFFRTENVADLAEKIKWALDNPDKMKIKAEDAYSKLTQNYTWELIADQYRKNFNNLIQT